MKCKACGKKADDYSSYLAYGEDGKAFAYCYDCWKLANSTEPIPFEPVNTILTKFLKDPNNWMVAIDVDGTLCEGEFWGGQEPEPIQWFIDKVCEWYKKGAHITIYTARKPEHYEATHAWLIKHGVPFHGICMTYKPGADIYFDDKAFRPEELQNG